MHSNDDLSAREREKFTSFKSTALQTPGFSKDYQRLKCWRKSWPKNYHVISSLLGNCLDFLGLRWMLPVLVLQASQEPSIIHLHPEQPKVCKTAAWVQLQIGLSEETVKVLSLSQDPRMLGVVKDLHKSSPSSLGMPGTLSGGGHKGQRGEFGQQ